MIIFSLKGLLRQGKKGDSNSMFFQVSICCMFSICLNKRSKAICRQFEYLFVKTYFLWTRNWSEKLKSGNNSIVHVHTLFRKNQFIRLKKHVQLHIKSVCVTVHQLAGIVQFDWYYRLYMFDNKSTEQNVCNFYLNHLCLLLFATASCSLRNEYILC